MNISLTTICNSVITCCKDPSLVVNESIRKAAEEVAEKGDFLKVDPANPLKLHTELFIKVMEEAFSEKDEENKKIKDFFKTGLKSSKIAYTEIAPLLLRKYLESVIGEQEEHPFVINLVNKIMLQALKILDADYTLSGPSNVVLYQYKNLSGGGGWEDYGGYQSTFTEAIISFDEVYRMMASTAILQLRNINSPPF